ncbi:MAG: hypothetical protein ACJ74Y_16735 [Bryobacteraceae bacterium]
MIMLPLTLLAIQKVSDLLTSDSALAQELTNLALSNGTNIPSVDSEHVIMSSVVNDLGDTDSRLGYPRVCLYSSGLKNSQHEKFCSVSGVLSATADIWTSANLLEDTDRWIHYYVEAVSVLLRKNSGDWGDGIFFSGVYDVQFQSPRTGGLGFIQLARLKFDLMVSQG